MIDSHASGLYPDRAWDSADRLTVAAGDTTNKALFAAAFAVLLMTMTVFLAGYGESDADTPGEYKELGGKDYYIVDGGKTYTDTMLKDNVCIYVIGTSIAENAFKNTNVRYAYLSSSVKTIGDNAFYGCRNLYSVNANSVTDIGESAFSNSKLSYLNVRDLTTIGPNAFENTDSLEFISLWNTGVTALESGTFRNSSLGLIDLRNITSIDPTAFFDSGIKIQVVTSDQECTIPGVSRLYYDTEPYQFKSIYMENGQAMISLDEYDYVCIKSKNGEDLAIHVDPTGPLSFYAKFTPEPGVDYTMTHRPAYIVFPDGLGLDDIGLGQSEFPYTLPTPEPVGDLEFVEWNVPGIEGAVSSITVKQMVSLNGYAHLKAVFTDAEIAYDHSEIADRVDVLGIPDRTSFTFGDAYPALPNLEGYLHIGWEVNGERHSPGDPICIFSDHTARSLWEPTTTYVLSYKDKDGTLLHEETYGLNTNVIPYMSIQVKEDESERLEGWSLEDGIPLESVCMDRDIVLYPVMGKRDLFDVTMENPDGSVTHLEVYDGRTVVLGDIVPERDAEIFLCWTDGRSAYGPGDTITITSDTEIVSDWRPKEVYNLAFVHPDGTETVETLEATEFTIKVSDPISYGKRFMGWLCSDGKTYHQGDSFIAPGDLTFDAIWEDLVHYRVTFLNERDVFHEGVTYDGYEYGIPEDVPVRENHLFLGWSVDGEIVEGNSITVTSDIRIYAEWKSLTQYAVSIDDGTSPVTSVMVYEGDRYTFESEEPKKNGMIFVGWYTDGTSILSGDTMVVTKDVSIRAVFREPSEFTVSFVDGNQTILTDKITEGEPYGISVANPQSEHGIFVGWVCSDGKVLTYGSVIVPESNVSLSAKWRERNEYTVTYSDGVAVVRTDKAYEGLDYTVSAPTPVPEGKTLSGWTDGTEVFRDGSEIIVTSDLELEAVLTDKAVFTVTYMDGDAPLDSMKMYDGSVFTHSMEPLPDRDLYFVAWTMDGKVLEDGTSLTVSEDIVICAQWRQPDQLTVTFMDGSKVIYYQTGTEGTMVVIDVSDPVSGDRRFLNWSLDGEPYSKGDSILLTENIVMDSVWEKKAIVTVTFKADGRVVGTQTGYEGAMLIIAQNNPPKEGKIFVDWYGNGHHYGNGDGITLCNDMTLEAQWRDLETKTLTLYSEGKITGTLQYQEGGKVILSKIPDKRPGYDFIGWAKEYGKPVSFFSGDSISPGGITALYAVWEESAEDPSTSPDDPVNTPDNDTDGPGANSDNGSGKNGNDGRSWERASLVMVAGVTAAIVALLAVVIRRS